MLEEGIILSSYFTDGVTVQLTRLDTVYNSLIKHSETEFYTAVEDGYMDILLPLKRKAIILLGSFYITVNDDIPLSVLADVLTFIENVLDAATKYEYVVTGDRAVDLSTLVMQDTLTPWSDMVSYIDTVDIKFIDFFLHMQTMVTEDDSTTLLDYSNISAIASRLDTNIFSFIEDNGIPVGLSPSYYESVNGITYGSIVVKKLAILACSNNTSDKEILMKHMSKWLENDVSKEDVIGYSFELKSTLED